MMRHIDPLALIIPLISGDPDPVSRLQMTSANEKAAPEGGF
jgi:hypothetical protein